MIAGARVLRPRPRRTVRSAPLRQGLVHLHRDEERYLTFLLARAHEVAAPLPGDVILFKLRPLFRARRHRHSGRSARASTPIRPARVVHRGGNRAQRRSRWRCARTNSSATGALSRWRCLHNLFRRRNQARLHRAADSRPRSTRCRSRSSGARPRWRQRRLVRQFPDPRQRRRRQGWHLQRTSRATRYTADLIMALCEGPISASAPSGATSRPTRSPSSV